MGRKSKLSPEQWSEIERRSAAGESSRALGKEFGVDESTVRAKVSPQTPRVRDVAAKLAEAQSALAELPVSQQYTAIGLAEKLRGISRDLAGAAAYGADTARRLKERANTETTRILKAEMMGPQEIAGMQVVSGLTKLANESAAIAQSLLANGDRGTLKQVQLMEQDTPDKPEAGAEDDMTPTFNITLRG